jgi:hypothetical protein
MDKIALFEIENAIKRAKQRMKTTPVTCSCMNEMEKKPGYYICMYCGKIEWTTQAYKQKSAAGNRPVYWYKKGE